jgi:hypothetical protein
MYIFKIPFLFIVIVLFGCKSTSENKVSKVGHDRDKHGCIHSAGYTWSEINKTCLRPFELNNQLFNADKTFIASVNVSNDGENAEVFSKEGYFLMKKKNDSTYIHSKAILILGKNQWIFSNKKNGFEYKRLNDH